MNKIIALVVLLILYGPGFGKQVDENTAKKVGLAFISGNTHSKVLKSATTMQLVYKAGSTAIDPVNFVRPEIFFYVFTISGSGFVIVSGDDNVTPILGYSDQAIFDPANIPQNVAKWLEGYKGGIREIILHKIQAGKDIADQWQALQKGGTPNSASKALAGVNPLIQTRWNQGTYYNAVCPGGSVTGCVATATAQIMKFWNYPATGSGFHSYNHNDYGTLSANFGSTTYQWNSMPNSLNSSNTAVATLMYQVGVSVEMNYSPQASGAYVISAQSQGTHCAEYALKTYFGYKNTLQGVQRSNYTEAQWMSLVKAELNASRPVLYAGYGSGGGHCFVADGYDDNNFIHFNWGWGGAYDGYFQVNALNPGGTGIGGGSGGYNSGHQAVIGIEPPSATPAYNMKLYDFVSPSAATIIYGTSFSVNTNIANYGNATFSGDFTAAIFDNSYNFVDYIETLTGYTLQGGYHYINNLVFSTAALYSLVPGKYYVGIFYRPAGGNWLQLANNGIYSNLVSMTVINPNNIELYRAMNPTPGTTLTQGDVASVNLNVINTGAATFYGKYRVGLFNLDGSLAQASGTITENNGLPYNYVYLNPYLTFNFGTVSVAPGTYLLAAQHDPNNLGWQLTGSSYYQNPIKVTVVAPTLQPDQYEPNNTTGGSYTLPVSFSGNNALSNTTGSNCHIVSDNDYYKINLPPGYNYSINPRLHDAFKSENGNTYSLDALFSYSVDGINWSGTFDDVLPASITMSGGHTIYFHVAPYFSGEKGTYLLEIPLTKLPWQFVWTGMANTDWSNGSNWSTGTVPTFADDIQIPAATPFSPVVNAGTSGNCKSLQAAPGASIRVSTGGSLKIGQ